MTTVESLRGGVIVSCQARADWHPLHPPSVIARLARCAEIGGGVAVRIDHPANVGAVRRRVAIPVIGLHKLSRPHGRSLITPTFERAEGLVTAGADIVALEAVAQDGVPNERATRLIQQVRDRLGVPVMADVSTLEEGLRAWDAGADLVGTTLSGYTHSSPQQTEPDLLLVEELAGRGVRVVAEGRLRSPAHVAEAFRRGAYSVVSGTAVTDPVEITRWLVDASPGTDDHGSAS